jgi:hypothetical protein
MKITGSKAQIFIDNFNSSNIVTGDGTITTTGNQKYFIISKGNSSNIDLPS